MALSFLFGGNTGETPQSIRQKRDLARAILGASNSPKNVGEGLNALGDGLVAGVLNRRADTAEAQGTKTADALFNSIIGGGTGSTSTPASSIPMTGAASEVQAGSPAVAVGNSEIADYIRQSASARGIDPDIALRVARSEGGFSNPTQQSNVVKNGVRETSYGPFQLRIGGGLGDAALKAGVDPRDPNQWKKGVDFALDQAAQGGWGPWYGARNQGIVGMAGIGRRPQLPTQQVASLDPSAGMPQPAAAQEMQSSSPTPGNIPVPTARPSAPAAAPAPTQVAQAQPAQAPQAAPQRMQINPLYLQALNNPWLSEGQRASIKMLIEQDLQAQQQAQDESTWLRRQQIEQQNKQSDPAYQLGLKKTQIELDNLQKDPGEIKVVNDRLVRAYKDGRVEDVTPAAPNNPSGQFRFDTKSVEGQALNGLIDSGQLTPQQAQQLAAGKQVTGPNGELLFLTPQSIFGGGGQPAQQNQSVELFPEQPQQDQGVNLFPEQPVQSQAPQVAPGSAVPGALPLTAPKSGESADAGQRAAVAKQYGLDPNSDEGKRYIMTGTLPASDKGVTAGDREAVRTADDSVLAGQSALTLLTKAKELSAKSYEGAGASQRAWLMSQFGDTDANNTREYDNILKEQALGQLKTIFGGAPTEGERAILLEIQGSSNQPIEVRNRIIDRAIQLVKNKIKFNQDRAQELRSGTYYKPDTSNGNNGQRTIRKFNPATGELE